MGAKAGKTSTPLKPIREDTLDLDKSHTVLHVYKDLVAVHVSSSHSQVTIHSLAESSLESLTVRGVSNRVRLERNAVLVDILGTDNTVVLAKGVKVKRLQIQGKEMGPGKKDWEEDTETGEWR